MRPTTSTARRLLRALLAAAVVSIVLGIVGMHALNTHATMSNADHATMTSPMSEQVTGSRGHAHAGMSDDMVTDGDVVPLGAAAASVGDTGQNTGDTLMLCVAMLAAAAGTLLLGLRRIPRVWAHLPAVPITIPRWCTAPLRTGPPPAWEFSVIRC